MSATRRHLPALAASALLLFGSAEIATALPLPVAEGHSSSLEQVRTRHGHRGWRHSYGGPRDTYGYPANSPYRPYGANTAITAPPGTAAHTIQRQRRHDFCQYAPSRCP